ncbi:MAG: hypothetical protein R6V53_06370 [Candidatus Woesearchaeota archaeon]
MKAQINQVFVILIGVIVIGGIILFATSTVTDIATKQCQIDAQRFKSDFERVKNQMTASRGKAVIEEFRIPCEVDQIIFFDNNKEVLFAGFEGLPVVMDALHSDTKENVFLMSGKDIVQSFHIPNIEVKVPYFTCTSITGNSIELMFKSDERGETHLQSVGQADCTFDYTIPLELSYDDAASVLYDIFQVNQSVFNYSIVDPIAAGLTRKVTLEDNKTIINVTKTNGTFDYYESIPKCAMESFMEFEDQGLISLDGDYQNLTDDPLIMWDFDSPGQDSATYVLKKAISAECLRGNSPGLFGIALARDPQIDPAKEQQAKALRNDSNVPPIENIMAKARDRIETEFEQKKKDLSGEIQELQEQVRNNESLTQNEKLSLMRDIDTLSGSLDKPRYAQQKAGTIETTLSTHNLEHLIKDVKPKVDSVMDGEYVVKQQVFKAYGVDTTCTDSNNGDWCYDGFNVSAQCGSSSTLRSIKCLGPGNGRCTYYNEPCSAGQICRDGMCVNDDPCVDSDGGINTQVFGSCEDNALKFDKCLDKYRIREYECVSGACVAHDLTLGADRICQDGKNVSKPEECHIEEKDEAFVCYEGDSQEESSECKESQNGGTYTKKVKCISPGNSGERCHKSGWEYYGSSDNYECDDGKVEEEGD